MTTLYVQFSDASDQTIVTVYGAPQDPDVVANYGTVDSSDPRYLAFYNSMPGIIQSGLPAPTTEAASS